MIGKIPVLVGFLGIALAGCATAPSEPVKSPVRAASSEIDPQFLANFPSCVATLKNEAERRGIPPSIIATLDKVQPDERVLTLDRKQPEFVQTFWDYLDKRVTQARIDKGRRLLAENAALLNRVESQYGVPPQVLVSFWGLESNFGSMTGSMEVVRSLTTLACDKRRSTMFASELMNALKIAAAGDATVQMKGSWAGAMGQTQFMPSTFLKFAVDGDGDGRRDLWGSLPDVFASSGHFLNSLGWERGQKWGEEVRLPPNFNASMAHAKNRRPLSYWQALGVTGVLGTPLVADAGGRDVSTAIILPMGLQGPAFAIYPNFDVIMKWNRSTNYAIAVGHLSDRIAGGGPLVAQPAPDAVTLRVAEIIEMQERLNALGFDAGTPDGTAGPMTSDAIRAYQDSQNLPADGYPSRELLLRLRGAGAMLVVPTEKKYALLPPPLPTGIWDDLLIFLKNA